MSRIIRFSIAAALILGVVLSAGKIAKAEPSQQGTVPGTLDWVVSSPPAGTIPPGGRISVREIPYGDLLRQGLIGNPPGDFPLWMLFRSRVAIEITIYDALGNRLPEAAKNIQVCHPFTWGDYGWHGQIRLWRPTPLPGYWMAFPTTYTRPYGPEGMPFLCTMTRYPGIYMVIAGWRLPPDKNQGTPPWVP